MPDNVIEECIKLRILVLALGEVQNWGWWKSQFLSSVGMSFLGRIYPRSDFAAAVHSANEAARQVHDSAIGIGGVYNLCRLQGHYENRIDSYLKENNDRLKAEYMPLLTDRSRLIELVFSFNKREPGNIPVGPLRLGTIGTKDLHQFINESADAYYSAFRYDKRIYPYIEEDKNNVL